jgi:hypothetical protein
MSNTMPWDEKVWHKLENGMSELPLFFRAKAFDKITEASERCAKERGAVMVQKEDLMKAADELVRAYGEMLPAFTRQSILETLAEEGVNIE